MSCPPAAHGLLQRHDRNTVERLLAHRAAGAEPSRGRRILCAACGHDVTREGDAAAYGGAHEHGFTNPAGIAFHIGCFRVAPGCAETGAPTVEHSWFPGYRWRYALCRGCGTHLGWSFNGPDHFFGLILPRLRREADD